jgi:hypothetical protein
MKHTNGSVNARTLNRRTLAAGIQIPAAAKTAAAAVWINVVDMKTINAAAAKIPVVVAPRNAAPAAQAKGMTVILAGANLMPSHPAQSAK